LLVVAGALAVPGAFADPASTGSAAGASGLTAGFSPLAMEPSSGAVAWGEGFYGELGNGRSGNGTSSIAPIAISGLSEVASVAAGGPDSFALLHNGTVMGWGADAVGQVGNGTSGETVNLPAAVCAQGEKAPCTQHLGNVTAIAAGEAFALALLSNGTVMAWGTNNRGELGDGSTTGPETCVEGLIACSRAPVPVPALSKVTAIAAGGEVALALLQSGKVMAWGRNVWGQLGSGSASEYSDVPVEVKSLSNVTAVSTGGTSSLALLNSGTVMAWGDNDSGQLGIGTTTGPEKCSGSACSATPLAVSGLSGVKALAGGWIHNLALLSNGTVTAWGNNNQGQLGDGSLVASDVPVAVSGLSGVTAIAAGYAHSLALLSNGTGLAWGWNSQWQLGAGVSELERSDLPIAVDGLKQATAIAAGYTHGLAIGAAGVLPSVTSVSPNIGPKTGGTSVKVLGSHFTGATAVKFGTTNASSFTVNSDTSISAVSPPGLGAVHVTVVTPEGTTITTSADEFGYALPTVTRIEPEEGPRNGGASVTITGTNLSEATAVRFGSTNATSFTVNSGTSITAIAPPASPSTVDIRVTTPAGTSATSVADQFQL
jgi:alpha-tubulin suppressor-like RCC1 family protein